MWAANSLPISQNEESSRIGELIFRNECGKDPHKLVCWNQGENFASVGIGHFIWYPEGKPSQFTETFPDLLAFFKAQKILLPKWLEESSSCPWATKQEFESPLQKEKKEDLRKLLQETLSIQVAFIYQRLKTASVKILDDLPKEKKKEMAKKIQTLLRTTKGRYALLDYLNFKGEGISEQERFQGEGWGLKQVLENMPIEEEDPVAAFSKTAQKILEKRVLLSPKERKESRWLPGWISRVRSYNEEP